MPLPPFVRSPAFLSGLGAAGSGVVGIGGWQIYEESYPTADRQLTRKNLLFKPALPTLEADTSDTKYGNKTGDKYHLQTYECFNRFFPGVEVKHTSLGNEGEFKDTFKNESNKAKESGTPLGCALMNLSYEGVNHDSTTHSKYVFKSEITVKNDTFGWALWVGSKYMKTGPATDAHDSNQKGAEYYLLFLEKEENKENSWSIIGGYFWTDYYGSSQSYNLNMLHISTPDKEDWASQIRNHKVNTQKEHKKYSGVWIASGAGNEVFKDIEFWYGSSDSNKSENAEILGRVNADFSGEPKIKSAEAYNKDSSGWRPFNGHTRGREGEEIGATLKAFYKPFKDKKGTWIKSEEYCSRNKTYSRELNKSQLEELENLCYSPQKN